MITNMNDRLKQFLAAENISQAQFADTINVVRASVSHVLSGRNNPSYDFIKAIMDNYPTLNIEWLILGKGKMYKGAQREEPAVLFNDLFEETEPVQESQIPEPQVTVEENTQFSAITETIENIVNQPVKQRKVSKIIVLFDDGTFQEM